MYCKVGAGVAWAIAFIYFCFICCCWKNIALGAAVMETSSAFVGQNLKVLTIPFFSYVIVFLFLIYWTLTAVYIYTIGEPEPVVGKVIANIKWDENTRKAMWFFFFGLFWCVAFLICQQQFIIGSMTCMWYFYGQGGNSDSAGDVSLLTAMKWGYFTHCGSIAFGSCIIAIVSMIRVIFEYIQRQQEAANPNNPVVKIVGCAVRCCLYLLDKYVKVISKNAFIQIILTSKPFCTACWMSFWLMIRNAGRFGSVAIISWIIMILGKATIMASSAYFTILLMQTKFPEVDNPFIPAILVGLFAYMIGSMFLSVFSFACTAIVHCFLLDEETGGGQDAPQYLQAFLNHVDAQNKKKEDEKKVEEANKVE